MKIHWQSRHTQTNASKARPCIYVSLLCTHNLQLCTKSMWEVVMPTGIYTRRWKHSNDFTIFNPTIITICRENKCQGNQFFKKISYDSTFMIILATPGQHIFFSNSLFQTLLSCQLAPVQATHNLFMPKLPSPFPYASALNYEISALCGWHRQC